MTHGKTMTGSEAHEQAMDELKRMREAGTLKPCCGECVWYRGVTERGECRVNPPGLSADGERPFPQVKSTDWCRKYEQRY